jgi:hypothetical protein
MRDYGDTPWVPRGLTAVGAVRFPVLPTNATGTAPEPSGGMQQGPRVQRLQFSEILFQTLIKHCTPLKSFGGDSSRF